MTKIYAFIKREGFFVCLSFVLPVLILAAVYARIGIYPGSEYRTIMASDSFSQYSNFFASLNNVLHGKQNIFYTWNASLGLNYWAFMAYYLGGIFSPLVVFFDNINMPDFLYYLTLLKFGCMGVSFYAFSSRAFAIPRWGHVQLALSYALMSYALAYSEIIMWLDALIYLPLIILGIHRVMDQRKPGLLFISYLLLFVSNFYMAFMVGVFSFLYFWTRLLLVERKQRLPKIKMYLATSLLAGGASMPIILPTLLDLTQNGEAFSTIKRLQTKGTGPWDLITKNMVGVYDSTKLVSTPFIYSGLFALMLCLFFFLTKKVGRKEKGLYGGLLLFLVISFYLEPLYLLWQGLHTPNMFNFRFSFLFSFLVLLLAGYGWEKIQKEDFDQLVTVVLGLILAFIGVWLLTNGDQEYSFLSTLSFIVSLAFLVGYLAWFYFATRKASNKWFALLLLLLVCGETGLNTVGIIEGIMYDWVYPSRSYYSEEAPDIEALVQQTKDDSETFYRMENLNPLSANDGFNYGYSGVNMFSSIRNRHSSSYLNALGYRSLSTNLNIRYANNTLLMDSLLGIKYNLAREDVLKYGYQQIGQHGDFYLYENDYALPLGILTDEGIYASGAVETQTTLFNHLAGTSLDYFTFGELQLLESTNVTIERDTINTTDIVAYVPDVYEEAMELSWSVDVPANKQAYISIYPVDHRTLGGPTLKLTVNGTAYETPVSETGQYYSLGYYEEAQTVNFTMTITGLKEEAEDVFAIVAPDAAFLDIGEYTQAVEKIQDKGVDFEVSGRKATAEVELSEDQVIFTSIPYDKGWKAYVDGKQVEIPTFKQALLTVPVSAGKHTIEFVFLPQGFVLGTILCVLCIVGFVVYWWILKKRVEDPFYQQD